MEVKINKLPKSEIEIEGEIPFSDLEVHRRQAIKKLSEGLNLPGFRKGHIPEKMALEKIGESNLLNEMAERALGNAYPKMIIDNKIDPIAHPQITITKIAMGNPLGFKIKVPVMPEIRLADYKNIASSVAKAMEDKKEVGVTKEDVEIVINQILDTKKDKDGKKPELTDELVKTLGDFKNLKDFNQKVEEGVRKEKEFRQKEKGRIQVMEEIISESQMDLPDIVIESELDKMIAGFKGDIERMGLKTDEYLKNNNKTVEDLRKEWRGEAEKKAKSQLILNKIAVDEKIYPKAEDVEKEAKHLMEHYPSTGSGQARPDPNRIKVYVETVLTNESVMQFLENPPVDEKEKSA